MKKTKREKEKEKALGADEAGGERNVQTEIGQMDTGKQFGNIAHPSTPDGP